MNEILGCVAFCTILFSVTFAFFPYVFSFEITYALSYVWCNDIFFGGGEERGGGSTVAETLAM